MLPHFLPKTLSSVSYFVPPDILVHGTMEVSLPWHAICDEYITMEMNNSSWLRFTAQPQVTPLGIVDFV